MADSFDHGPRLSEAEYRKKIIELHTALPPMPTKEQDTAARRRELNLAIDHCLGRDFPPDRREALWAINQRVEKKRIWLAVKYVFRKVFSRSIARDAQGLGDFLFDEYAKVLTESELQSFFGIQKGERPVLPIDGGGLKK